MVDLTNYTKTDLDNLYLDVGVEPGTTPDWVERKPSQAESGGG